VNTFAFQPESRMPIPQAEFIPFLQRPSGGRLVGKLANAYHGTLAWVISQSPHYQNQG